MIDTPWRSGGFFPEAEEIGASLMASYRRLPLGGDVVEGVLQPALVGGRIQVWRDRLQ